jgi:hypothetical protein
VEKKEDKKVDKKDIKVEEKKNTRKSKIELSIKKASDPP